MYKISSKFPIPSKRETYPFTQMQPGESIFVPFPNAHSARVSSQQIARRYNIRFASQTRCEDGVMGMRIWRTV
jgi:hypothetical protein